MRNIDVLIQQEGVSDIRMVSAALNDTVDATLSKIERYAAKEPDLLVFLEDMPGPIETDVLIEELLPLVVDEDASEIAPVRLHLSCCRRIQVTVRFNGEEAQRRFPPSATVERVRRWAARRAFGLSPCDAAEHVLQLQGTTTRPDRDVHIGSLTARSVCAVAFDLVPLKRVEG